MSTSPDKLAGGLLPETNFYQALTAEKRSIRNRAIFFVIAVTLMSTGLAFMGLFPCLFLTGAGDDMAQCTLATMMTLVSGDTVFLRETSGWLLAIFVAMMLAVVFMRPRVGVDDAPVEAARGALASLTSVTGLVTSVLALFWSASASIRWADPLERDDVHLLEIPLGVLTVAFCAVATTVLIPGLGVTVNNIRWAKNRVDSLRQWDVDKRRSETHRADGEATLSLLVLVVSIASTRPYWEPFFPSQAVQTTVILFVGLSSMCFVALVGMKIHLDPDRTVHRVGRAIIAVAMSFYLFPVAASVVPVVPAVFVSITVAWFLHAASAAFAYASYEISMPRILSMKESVRRELTRCQKIVIDNERRLREPHIQRR